MKYIKSNPDLLVFQSDFIKLDLLETSIGSVKVYCPPEGTDQVGYYGFPGVNCSKDVKKIAMLGNEIEDGFCGVDSKKSKMR